jgi:hypothetical protein
MARARGAACAWLVPGTSATSSSANPAEGIRLEMIMATR